MTAPLYDTDILHVAASTDRLSEIREFVRARITDIGFSDLEEDNIVLAVDEACANLIQHAYKNDASQTIDVRIILTPQEVRVEISDRAAPFDPGTAALPDMRAYFAERRHHGLGILLMTRVMDRIEYQPARAGGQPNTLVLSKRLTA